MPTRFNRCVFNALTVEDLLLGVGRASREAAAAEGPLDEYERSQLLSAYSVTRLLAAEQAAGRELLEWTRAELDTVLDGDPRADVAAARRRTREAATGIELGDALGDLLAALPRADPIRTGVHRVLAGMIDREVAALAAPPS